MIPAGMFQESFLESANSDCVILAGMHDSDWNFTHNARVLFGVLILAGLLPIVHVMESGWNELVFGTHRTECLRLVCSETTAL